MFIDDLKFIKTTVTVRTGYYYGNIIFRNWDPSPVLIFDPKREYLLYIGPAPAMLLRTSAIEC